MGQMVWKFKIDLFRDDWQSLEMPEGTYPLMVAMQDHNLCMWAAFDEAALKDEKVMQEYIVTGTGFRVPDGAEHVGSVMSGTFVWHVWRKRGLEVAA